MIYMTTILFPICSIIAGLAALRGLFSFVAAIQADSRRTEDQ